MCDMCDMCDMGDVKVADLKGVLKKNVRKILEIAEKEEQERRKGVDIWTQGRRAKRVAVFKLKELARKKLI